MEVHFTPDQEAQLAQLATKAGTDAEHLVKAAALRLLEDETYFHVPPEGGPDHPRYGALAATIHSKVRTRIRRTNGHFLIDK